MIGLRPAYLTKRFVFLLEENIEVKMCSLGKYYGLHVTLSGQDMVLINHSKGDILGTLVHELLHFLYENKSHKWIYEQEDYWMKKSSWKQKKRVLYELFNLT